MEKYLRGLNGGGSGGSSTPEDDTNNCGGMMAKNEINNGGELSKWLESAANFTPKKNNYIEWDPRLECANSHQFN